MSSRTMAPLLCRKLQPLTQCAVISPQSAGNIVSQYIRGDDSPLRELVSSREIPVSFLPVVNEINQIFLERRNSIC